MLARRMRFPVLIVYFPVMLLVVEAGVAVGSNFLLTHEVGGSVTSILAFTWYIAFYFHKERRTTVESSLRSQVMRRVTAVILVFTLIVILCSCTASSGDSAEVSDFDAKASIPAPNADISTPATDNESEDVAVDAELSEPVLNVDKDEMPWQDAYASLVKDYSALGDYIYFIVHDLDKDGIPELIIFGVESYYDDERFVFAYTFRDGGLLSLEYDEDLDFASYILSARARTTAAPFNAPGLVLYFIGASSGIFGASYYYTRVAVEGNRLVLYAEGKKYIDVGALNELYADFGREDDIDHDVLYNDIEKHTHYFVNDKTVPRKEHERMFEYGEWISIYRYNDADILEAIYSYTEAPVDEVYFPTHMLEQHLNPVIVEEGEYHRVYRDDYGNNLCMIFDKKRSVVALEQNHRWPHIITYDDSLVSVSVQAGTGIYTCWTYYYSVEDDVFSEEFYAVFQRKDNRIIYAECDTVVVRDIFSEAEYYQVFSDFEGISKKTVEPIIGAEFTDDGMKISVTYLNENFDEITVIFDLNATTARLS